MKMDLSLLKRALPLVLSVIVIASFVSIYFMPQLRGDILNGSDIKSSTAWHQHLIEHRNETGEHSYWNPSMFSGMPFSLLSAGAQYNWLRPSDKYLRLGFKQPMGLAVKAGLLTFISLILLKIRWEIALLGGLAFAFNTNYIVLLEVGHQSKLNVLSNFPLIFAGLILCYRSNWKIGFPAIAFGTSMAIANNHIQMVYYLLLAFVVFALVKLVYAIKENQVSTFFRHSGIALAAAILGALSNISVLFSSLSFADDTMRGKPILEQSNVLQTATSSATDGLEWGYATQWSNDTKEILSLFIPRMAGGSSGEEVPANSEVGKLLRQNNAIRGSDNTYTAPFYFYWGSLPFTEGPYYCGIALLVLFVLAFFMVPPQMRWAIGLSVLFVLVLSLGKNAEGINKPLFDTLPMFNKFRAPSSAVNIVPLFLIIMSCLGIASFVKTKKRSTLTKPVLYTSAIVLLPFLVLLVLGESLFAFEGPSDSRLSTQVVGILQDTRKELFIEDIQRSLVISLLVLGLLYAYAKNVLKNATIFLMLATLFVFTDLYVINRRYLDSDNWESSRTYFASFDRRPADEQILSIETKGRGQYRVFDVSNMKSALGSYYHNTIGGYHPAKLQRYQDMLDRYINRSHAGVLNMLNAKYIIRDNKLELNPDAFGVAWCVNDIKYVSSASEELNEIANTDLRNVAIINSRDFPDAQNNVSVGNGSCQIQLTFSNANTWEYDFSSTTNQFLVFSEVWYDQAKGMKVEVDGIETDLYRVNYLLRAIQVPGGNHKIKVEFRPVIRAASINILASILIIFSLLYAFIDSMGYLPDKYSFGNAKQKKPIKKSKKRLKKKSK